jgi:hypothetical protein
VIVASIYGTAFIVVGTLLAFWSLWWIIKAAMTNPSEREAEDEARAAVARGEGWADENGSARQPFTDAEIKTLSDALAAEDPTEAGVDVRPREDDSRKRRR